MLLEDQDRSLWDRQRIEEGSALVRRALAARRLGFYTLQAAISAVHAEAKEAVTTDWNRIVALYSVLQQIDSSPVIALNRAVAVAMRDGPSAGLQLVDDILAGGVLSDYHLIHSTRGELLRRDGDHAAAREAFERALSLTRQAPEQRLLRRRLAMLQSL